ncbi:competence type IV pilus ATPase ComGA [Candidatus Enterococcus willemsii]|uniref:Secretion system protein E n=1 Tax=Candidatus Enterococcus willemsii TaxID=1857215 RepID=A0ABQ6YW47_9ENTE|nr:competence type IV pilus ATPase ComGA [Enterococcus sp. CU12B]KAF1301921.1 secretion system protein E [Enterococcus sp. CU12B]
MDIQTLSDTLISYGKEQHMQDLYLYPVGEETDIIFRRSTQTMVYQTISTDIANQLIARFKYLGEMDVGEKRKAQLGAISYPLDNEKQRLRLSTVGDYRGQESMVIRFLHENQHVKLDYFFPEDVPLIQQKVADEIGLYLFSGPTGSGKTTLMYHLARQLPGQVIAIEDPVEIEEVSFLQLQTNEKIQQTYEQLIKLSLRHRPDVLIIGEIRDEATARAAIRAALTGHTVFATIHAKNVSETRLRLIDLVGESAELSSCLSGIIYQRLLLDKSQCLKGLLAYEFYNGAKEKQSFSTRYQQIKKGQVDERGNLP